MLLNSIGSLPGLSLTRNSKLSTLLSSEPSVAATERTSNPSAKVVVVVVEVLVVVAVVLVVIVVVDIVVVDVLVVVVGVVVVVLVVVLVVDVVVVEVIVVVLVLVVVLAGILVDVVRLVEVLVDVVVLVEVLVVAIGGMVVVGVVVDVWASLPGLSDPPKMLFHKISICVPIQVTGSNAATVGVKRINNEMHIPHPLSPFIFI